MAVLGLAVRRALWPVGALYLLMLEIFAYCEDSRCAVGCRADPLVRKRPPGRAPDLWLGVVALWSRPLACALLISFLSLAANPDPRQTLWSDLGKPPIVDHGQGVVAWRFQDPTEAYAASLTASKQHPQLFGNYLVFCDGPCPPDLNTQVEAFPKMTNGPLPVLRTYLPEKGLIPDSRRYILNEQNLAAATPEIPATAAAFQFGTEAIVGRYKTRQGDETLAIFNYPTPQIARAQLPEFQKIQGVTVKRSGPLVALVLNAPGQTEANRLLGDLEYAASISWDEKPPLIIRPQTAAQIVLGGMELAGIILVFCLLSGLAYAGIRILQRRFGNQGAGAAMIVLGLEDK